jgi:hypothetical protein
MLSRALTGGGKHGLKCRSDFQKIVAKIMALDYTIPEKLQLSDSVKDLLSKVRPRSREARFAWSFLLLCLVPSARCALACSRALVLLLICRNIGHAPRATMGPEPGRSRRHVIVRAPVQIFVKDPEKRLSIPEIKQHEWFLHRLPFELCEGYKGFERCARPPVSWV